MVRTSSTNCETPRVRRRGASDADAISSRLDVAGFRCLDGEILMGDVKNGYQATPNATLEQQMMDACAPKNEREWWAFAEIGRLRAAG